MQIKHLELTSNSRNIENVYESMFTFASKMASSASAKRRPIQVRRP